MIKKSSPILLIFIAATVVSSAQLKLPAVFSDSMVLQREQPVPIWGTANASAKVTVDFAGQTKTIMADAHGKWRVDLDPMQASSEPRVLKISSAFKLATDQRQFIDILIGEVWFCSGQSNMEMTMKQTEDAETVIVAANNPHLRLYKTPRVAAKEPTEIIDTQWKVCSPVAAKYFSGVAYYFGGKLQDDLDVPVGLILSASGSTHIESWTPECGYKGIDTLHDLYLQTKNIPEMSGNYKKDRQIPSALYNGMIHAHIPYAIRGVIWYQGEANRNDGMLYRDKTEALLNGWRSLWGYDFPYYFVQIAPYQYSDEDPYTLPALWEAQSAIVKTIPNTGMAVVSDYATLDNIHPPNKEIPGTRLALLAEANTYGINVVSTGPVFQTLEKQGDTLKVIFSSAEGLTTRDSQTPNWFEIAGTDGIYHPAQAEIQDNAVILRSPDVLIPVSMRFAWNKIAVPNLINSAGLPASAFRAE